MTYDVFGGTLNLAQSIVEKWDERLMKGRFRWFFVAPRTWNWLPTKLKLSRSAASVKRFLKVFYRTACIYERWRWNAPPASPRCKCRQRATNIFLYCITWYCPTFELISGTVWSTGRYRDRQFITLATVGRHGSEWSQCRSVHHHLYRRRRRRL